MLDYLLSWDFWLFRQIHLEAQSAWADAFLPIWRSRSLWLPFYALLAIWLVWKYRLGGVYLILLIVLAVVCSDLTSSHLLKKTIMRLRPCAEPALADWHRQLMPTCAGYSFTSSHAANHFAMASMIWLIIKPYYKGIIPFLLLYFWAGSIALSQVYVGLHYPSDILGGAILGSSIAALIYRGLGQVLPQRR